ncbi:MAG: hypothetical protein LBW77_05215 [Verrucomicrobiota bacterium]|jgi:hypothetical protein|nr:hypothetical protein [Verrucomicrobiota bacterium]
MNSTYKAWLTDDQRLDWREDQPPWKGGTVPVLVTFLENTAAPSPRAPSRRSAECLTRLAELGDAFEGVRDPVQWQREQRLERPLPGRED